MCMGKNSYDSDTLSLHELSLKNSDYKIILGTTIDRKLTFNKCIKNLRKKNRSKTMRTSKNITNLDENKKNYYIAL